ncbi:MAG: hypothetical protein AB7Q01_16355 [Gammaproteobacteria bacterium]
MQVSLDSNGRAKLSALSYMFRIIGSPGRCIVELHQFLDVKGWMIACGPPALQQGVLPRGAKSSFLHAGTEGLHVLPACAGARFDGAP